MKHNQITKQTDSAENGPLKVEFNENQTAMQLFGERNRHLKKLSAILDLTISARGNTAFIQGDPIDAQLALNILEQLYALIQDGYPIHSNDIDYAVNVLSRDHRTDLKKNLSGRGLCKIQTEFYYTQKPGSKRLHRCHS